MCLHVYGQCLASGAEELSQKQIIQMKHNKVKAPTAGRKQLAIITNVAWAELGSTVKQSLVVRAGLELATSGFRVRRPNHSVT